jgi:phage repressor protein C with HTH and peptisase S24 domain
MSNQILKAKQTAIVRRILDAYKCGRDEDLEGKLGVNRRSISNYRNGIRHISLDHLEKTARDTGVSLDWLLTGQKTGSSLHIEISKVAITSRRTEALNATDISVEHYYAAPLLEDHIAAGSGAIMRDQIKSLVWIYAPELHGRTKHDLVAVQLKKDADSMTPTLYPGDIVLIDRDDPGSSSEFVDQKIYAIRDEEGGCAVKRLYRSKTGLIVNSDNRAYAPELAWTDDVQRLIVGRVVWGWRNLLHV